MDKNYKILIPKYLTISRILATPIIILFGILKLNILEVILTIIISSTNLFDTVLSKVWRVESKKRDKLDLFASKIFVFGLILSLMFKFHLLIIIFILEIIISGLNIYFFDKTNKMQVLTIGKIKFTSLVILFVILMLNLSTSWYTGFSYLVINLQVLSIIHYILFYTSYTKNKPSIEQNIMHQEIMQSKELEDTIVLDNIQHLEKQIYDIEKDQF